MGIIQATTFMQMTIAFLVAAAIPIICLGIIYTRNLYSTSQIGIVILCFAWGVIGFFMAAEVNTFILTNAHMDVPTVTRYIAPITEEIIKAALLVYLIRRRSFHYFVDGAIYGFAVGIGFAVVENYRYINTYSSIALSLALGRTFSTNLIHATASAIVGMMLGLGRFQKSAARRPLYLFSGVLIAALIHGGFNNLVSRLSGERWVIYTYAAAVGISGASLIVYLIQRGLREERRWIDEMLGVADQVTHGESRMVLHLAEASVLLTPIVERFGKQKATLIGRLLVVQAQLGILRKTLQVIPDEKTRRNVKEEISGLQEEMAALRNRIGVYPMLYLRSIFPDENTSVWNRLEVVAARNAEEKEKAEVASQDFSLTDMQNLPDQQRQIMQAMLRGRKRRAYHDLQAELTRPARERPLTEHEFAEAFQTLVRTRKITGVEDMPDFYEVNIRRKAGLTLNDNIWDKLSILSRETSAGNMNVWDDLKNLLMEQSQTKPGTNLWGMLAERIPD